MGKGFDSESAFFIRWLIYSSKSFQKGDWLEHAHRKVCA